MSKEAFEQKYGQSWSDTPPHVRKLWLEAWQAATSAQEARVRELEEALLSILRLKEAEASLGGMRGGRIESIARKALSATAREPKS